MGNELQGCGIERRAIIQLLIISHCQCRNWYIPTTLQPQTNGLLGLRLVDELDDNNNNFDGDLAAKGGTINAKKMTTMTATPHPDYRLVFTPSSTKLLQLVAERFPWDWARLVAATFTRKEK
jgi:hypothetical protein